MYVKRMEFNVENGSSKPYECFIRLKGFLQKQQRFKKGFRVLFNNFIV